MRRFVPPVVAPPSSLFSTDRNFLDHQSRLQDAPLEFMLLYDLAPQAREDPILYDGFEEKFPRISVSGLMSTSSVDQLPFSYTQVPEARRLIYDSGKLVLLDHLLHEVKAGDYRILIYFQMTRMMDLIEKYQIYRQYKYLRLDGSSKIEDRHDMVMDWPTKYVLGHLLVMILPPASRPDSFVFILSTRTGGLGINFTAADTVIFYDHELESFQ